MKKNAIFSALILIVAILLFLLRATGLVAHIIVSVVGLVLLMVYTVQTKRDWKVPALEILMRVFYAVALITGAVLMATGGAAALAIVHKIAAALFVVLLVVLFVMKACAKAK